MTANIFQYLKDDDARIEEQLDFLVNHYSDSSKEQILDASQKIFQAVRDHVHKKEPILANELREMEDMGTLMNEYSQERGELDTELDNIINIHVDELEYIQSLKSLLEKVRKHREFCNKILYPELERRISQRDLANINTQLEQNMHAP